MLRPFAVASRYCVLFLAAAIACSSDETTGPPESIQVDVATNVVSIQRGATATLTASLIRGGGFDGPVTLTVSDLPSGVSVALSPDELTGTASTATISIMVGSSATTGSYTITITASASIDEVETSCVLVITDPPDFSLSAAAELTVIRGNAVTTTIQITRIGGHDGAVSLTLADPLPPGIAGGFQPPVTAGNSSLLTLTVAASVAPGRYLIPVYGTAESLPAREVTIFLTVTGTEPPDFELAVEPNVLTVPAGESVIGSVILTPSGGYDKYADLSLVSPPAGITAEFEWYYGWVAAMVISVAPTVAPGAYEMTLRGVAEVGTHTTPFTLTVTAARDFALVLAPSTLSIEQGDEGSANVNITRTGGYAGTIVLSLVNPPAGVTATFTPMTVSANSASMTLKVSASVPPRTYALTVRGTGSGLGDRDGTLTLTVLAASPDFSLSAPAESRVVRGSSVSASIWITRRGGYAGAVSLSLAGPLPAGIQGDLQPATTTGDNATLTLTVATTVVVGRYQITVNGTSGTMPIRAVTIDLVVTASEEPGGPDFELVVEPGTLTVRAGASVIGTVTLIPSGGYDKYADLSLVSPPAGITAEFEWYWGWEADMKITVAPTVPPGTYAMTLRGTAEVGTHDTGFTLTVTAAEDFAQGLTSCCLRLIKPGQNGFEAPASSADCLLHERDDPCLFGGRQCLERERSRPHGAVVDVRGVRESERRVSRLELVCALEEADDLAVPGIRGHPVPGLR